MIGTRRGRMNRISWAAWIGSATGLVEKMNGTGRSAKAGLESDGVRRKASHWWIGTGDVMAGRIR